MTDIEIAQSVEMKNIKYIAKDFGVEEKYLELYGNYKAKISLKAMDNREEKGKLILVSALTPTAAGEGKTTVSIGLAQGLKKIGKNVSIALREASLGPVMGIKGGATGGGYSQVLPMEDINLHFTGDIHAITSAHNLIAAVIDNVLHFRTFPLNPKRVVWGRVMDMNDRSLRHIVTGLGAKNGMTKESGFDITAASEIMATLCIAKDYNDLKRRIGNILIGYDYDKKPVLVKDLKIEGAVTALLKDAIKPNLVQTIEGVPALIHGGPFANIAQGTNSLIATKMALAYSDYVVTEAGFGFDLGGEKFLDIKSRYGNLDPKAIVLVATIRALKMHGGVPKKELNNPNPEAVEKGLINLEKHIENAVKFGFNPIIAINKFSNDTKEEIDAIVNCCISHKYKVVISDVWGKGGEGAIELAEKVVESIEKNENKLKLLYDLDMKVEDKIEKIVKEIYGAGDIMYYKPAKLALKRIYKFGYDKFAICMAKTQSSLSDNPKLLGRPEGFTFEIKDILINAGPEFLVVISGEIMRMPGLPRVPAAEKIDIDENGKISGLF